MAFKPPGRQELLRNELHLAWQQLLLEGEGRKALDAGLAGVDFYGKVVPGAVGGPGRVRFTSVPPEVAAYLEGLLPAR